MSAGTPTRIGIVGTGAIARKHIAAIEQVPDQVQITAICDANPAALQSAVAEVPGAQPFDDLATLLESGAIDAGIICTPHFLHAAQAIAFAEAGIPVLVEKPLVISVQELRALHAAAEKTNTLVTAGQMHRFDAANVLARRWLDQDPSRFGELQSFEMHCWQDIMQYAAAVGTSHWLMDGRLAGGGVVVSLAVHQLDAVRYLTGVDYAEVSARGRFTPPFHDGAESSASILARMSNDATGTIFANYNAPRAFASESFSLFGETGGIGRQNRPLGDYLGPLLWASAHDVDDVLNISDAAVDPSSPEAALISDLHADRFVNQIVHFTAAVRGEVQAQNTIAENFNTIATIEAINRSIAADGALITVETL